MSSVLEDIKKRISRKRRGSIFFSDDFLSIATRSSVNKALSDLCKRGEIVRIGTGIYCKPKEDNQLGLGIIYPGVDEIAKAIAGRDKARIIPTGVYAQNRLGLSTQIPSNCVYLTDGSPRRIKIYGGSGILFIHVSPKQFSFKNKIAMMLTMALKDLGEGNISEDQRKVIKSIINSKYRQSIVEDYPLMPDWIRKLLISLYD